MLLSQFSAMTMAEFDAYITGDVHYERHEDLQGPASDAASHICTADALGNAFCRLRKHQEYNYLADEISIMVVYYRCGVDLKVKGAQTRVCPAPEHDRRVVHP